ncbi:MAG: hypothetical protein ACKVX7_19630 [Planctomycetota bacterium]
MMPGFIDALENPLIWRTLRTGFRPGKAGFNLTIWWLALVLILGVVYLLATFASSPRQNFWWQLLGSWLIVYNSAAFIFHGLPRLASTCSQERERGTIDFLRLSAMRPSAMIWGFIGHGLMPAFFLQLVVLPILALCAWMGQANFFSYLAIEGMLAFYALALSLILANLGLWSVRPSEQRMFTVVLGAALWGLNIYLLAGVPSWLPDALIQVFAVYPAISGLLNHAESGRDILEVPFFQLSVPLPLMSVIALLPPMVVLSRSASRWVRLSVLKPLHDADVLAMLTWLCVLILGYYWQSSVAPERALFILMLSYFFIARLLLHVNSRDRSSILRELARRDGRIRAYLLSSFAPSYRLLPIVTVLLAFAFMIFSATHPMQSTSIGLFVVLVYLVACVLTGQALQLRLSARLAKIIGRVSIFVLFWGPAVVFLILLGNSHLQSQMSPTLTLGLVGYANLNPFALILSEYLVNARVDAELIANINFAMPIVFAVCACAAAWVNWDAIVKLRAMLPNDLRRAAARNDTAEAPIARE